MSRMPQTKSAQPCIGSYVKQDFLSSGVTARPACDSTSDTCYSGEGLSSAKRRPKTSLTLECIPGLILLMVQSSSSEALRTGALAHAAESFLIENLLAQASCSRKAV